MVRINPGYGNVPGVLFKFKKSRARRARRLLLNYFLSFYFFTILLLPQYYNFSTNYFLFLTKAFFCQASTVTSKFDAINIDEYVPKKIPNKSVKAKFLVATGPIR